MLKPLSCAGTTGSLQKSRTDMKIADNKKPEHLCSGFSVVAERTGLEPATPCVTGRYSNQLNYRSAFSRRVRTIPRPRLLGAWQCPTLAWRMPHYHRRYSVSLLCSAWIQVVPLRYRRQANSLNLKKTDSALLATTSLKTSWVLYG